MSQDNNGVLLKLIGFLIWGIFLFGMQVWSAYEAVTAFTAGETHKAIYWLLAFAILRQEGRRFSSRWEKWNNEAIR